MTNAQIMDLYERSAKPMSVDAMLNIAKASAILELEASIFDLTLRSMPMLRWMPGVAEAIQKKRNEMRRQFDEMVAPYRVTEETKGTEEYQSKGGML